MDTDYMIVVYKKIPEATIRVEAEKAIKQITEWFANNLNRKDCKAEVWYGELITVRRQYIQKDVTAAMKKALRGT